VLTGGGDAPGLNAVIRAVVKSALNRGWVVFGVQDGFEGFFKPSGIRELGPTDVRGILQTGGTVLGCSNRGNPFGSRSDGPARAVREDRSPEVRERIEALGLDALVVTGGDGTLAIAARLEQEQGIPVVGIPKTIDNDVSGTDVTFGHDTACQTATDAIDRLHTTAASHQRVMVIEVMGRDAGWIALRAGAAGGGDVILIPEIPYDFDAVCRKVLDRRGHGAPFSLVVVAEGAFPAGGEKVRMVSAAESATGFERLGGIGAFVASRLERECRIETRVTVLGHLQRGGSPTHRDRMLGTRYGVGAVELAAKGLTGRMVALRGEEIVSVPLADVVGKLKLVDPNGEEVHAVESIGVGFGR
jgi:6-phosphofructokinase 1